MISIIIPAYNSATFIQRACDSVICQNFNDWELIVVNDGSSDNTSSLVERMYNNISKIKLLNIDNGGAYRARLKGVQIAQGDYILFIDSDDTITNNALSELYRIAKTADYDIVVGGLNINNKYNFKFDKSGELCKEEYIKLLLEGGTTIGVVAKLFKKMLFANLCDNKSVGLSNNEDLLMNIELAKMADHIFIASETIAYNYIFRSDSISKSQFMNLDKWWTLFEIIENKINDLHNDNIFCAFYKYKLRLLYTNILMGNFVNPKDNRIKHIHNLHLTGQYLHYERTIKSPVKQRLEFLLYQARKKLSNTIKLIYTNE